MLLAYILIPVMQKDTVWNSHRIHAQKDTHLPNGVPNHVHSFPEEYGLEECGKYFIWSFDSFNLTNSKFCTTKLNRIYQTNRYSEVQ